MKIECLVKRDGGSHVELGSKTYHFAPQADGCHVADIEDEEHIDRFLSITEGYRLYRANRVEKAKEAVKDDGEATANEGKPKQEKAPKQKASAEKAKEAAKDE